MYLHRGALHSCTVQIANVQKGIVPHDTAPPLPKSSAALSADIERPNVRAFIAACIDRVAGEAEVHTPTSHAGVGRKLNPVVGVDIARTAETYRWLVCALPQRNVMNMVPTDGDITLN